MQILFLTNNFQKYSIALENAISKNCLTKLKVTCSEGMEPDKVKFIIFEQVGDKEGGLNVDFSRFINNLGIFSLWAGVDQLVKNTSIKSTPIIRMVDENLTRGMVEWCIAHTMRIHLNLDKYILGQDGIWRHNVKPSLAKDKSIGILGLGKLGSEVAITLKNLGFQIYGWSRQKKNLKGIDCQFGIDGFHKVLRNSNILIMLLPLTDQTNEILNIQTIKSLPKNAVILNPGRGELINERALLYYINSGHLAHATLDVFNQEPLPSSHPFWIHPKILVTPHIAATTQAVSAADNIIKNIKRMLLNQKPIGLVDMKTRY